RVNVNLVRIGRDQWDVLAVCDERGACPVLDVLEALSSSYPAAVDGMLSLLRERIPQDGPQGLRAPTCKSLGNGLWEFRKEPKGRRLRVIWFYDFGRIVVCTVAFTKTER